MQLVDRDLRCRDGKVRIRSRKKMESTNQDVRGLDGKVQGCPMVKTLTGSRCPGSHQAGCRLSWHYRLEYRRIHTLQAEGLASGSLAARC